MKKVYLLTMTELFFCINLIFAQKIKEIKNTEVTGIYLTQEDFKDNKLACHIDKQKKKKRIKLNQFFISPEVSCIEIDNKTKFSKDSIFAIHLDNGENYRFLKNSPCLIADTSYLYIYTHSTIKTEYEQLGPRRRAKEKVVTHYYFSTGTHKNTYTLNLTNLCRYALSDTNIQSKVINKFTTDDMLYAVNKNSGRFVLNEFLLELVK